MTNEQTHISKFLSLVLRHKPEEINIILDANGWTDVSILLENMRKKGKQVTLADLKIVVDEDSKGRYSFKEDMNLIRANQGHNKTLSIDLEMNPLLLREIPSCLYHGTDSRFYDKIMKEGLKAMDRHYVHLTDDIDTAMNVGARRKKQDTKTELFKISSIELFNASFDVFKSENGVYLVKSVPAKYLR